MLEASSWNTGNIQAVNGTCTSRQRNGGQVRSGILHPEKVTEALRRVKVAKGEGAGTGEPGGSAETAPGGRFRKLERSSGSDTWLVPRDLLARLSECRGQQASQRATGQLKDRALWLFHAASPGTASLGQKRSQQSGQSCVGVPSGFV